MHPPIFSVRIRKDRKSKNQHIILAGDIGIKCIDQIKSRIESIEIGSREVVIELKNIHSIDLSTVQLIYSLRKSLGDKGIKAELVSDIPEELILILRNTGFDDLIKS